MRNYIFDIANDPIPAKAHKLQFVATITPEPSPLVGTGQTEKRSNKHRHTQTKLINSGRNV